MKRNEEVNEIEKTIAKVEIGEELCENIGNIQLE